LLTTGERSTALDEERPPEPGPNLVCLHKEAFPAQYYSQTLVSSSPTCILAPSLCQRASEVANSCSKHVENEMFLECRVRHTRSRRFIQVLVVHLQLLLGLPLEIRRPPTTIACHISLGQKWGRRLGSVSVCAVLCMHDVGYVILCMYDTMCVMYVILCM
jgi:hypothetical protein